MGLPIDPLDSPFDLHDLVLDRRKLQKIDDVRTEPPVAQQNRTLDETTLKTEEMQRMRASLGSGMFDDGALVDKVNHRWLIACTTKHGQYGDAVIFIDNETLSNKELILQFKADSCQIIVRQRAGARRGVHESQHRPNLPLSASASRHG